MFTGNNKHLIYLFFMIGGHFGRISVPCSLKSKKRNEERQKDFAMFRKEISTEWHSLKRGFKAINRFLVPLA